MMNNMIIKYINCDNIKIINPIVILIKVYFSKNKITKFYNLHSLRLSVHLNYYVILNSKRLILKKH